jgi:DNA invertase Pin-like site-specific DNA recombinase
MNIAAYCRVSTDKEDQLNSLEAQSNSINNTFNQSNKK